MKYRVNAIEIVQNAWGNVHYINNNPEHYVVTESRSETSVRCELVNNGFCKVAEYCHPSNIPETIIKLIKTGL